ncbi:hypothetical protein KSF73_07230 [Burkholderiaceae bacterium DAT-1]|nr:hypothetical protein [Burkholderiaceae bacterium DAT-1]
METLLILILQGAGEFLLNVLAAIPFEWAAARHTTEDKGQASAHCAFWSILGGVVGGLSLLILPLTAIHWPALRIANLLLAPLLSGYVARTLALRRAANQSDIQPRYHFWYAFCFTLGLVVIRFVFAGRG